VISLGGALLKQNSWLLWLTSGLVMVAALPGIIFHSLALFAVLYMILLGLSLPAAFATSIQFQGEPRARPEKR
jgi:hypothetical protein